MPKFNDWFPGSQFGSDVINVKAFGAKGDGNLNTMNTLFGGNLTAAQAVYPKATSLNDTADWCGIQAAIDYALNPTGATNPVNCYIHVHIPSGIYLINDTIHLGYGMINGGANSQSIQLSGAGWADVSGYAHGTTIILQFVDRPGINIQGGRESGVRNLAIRGLETIPDHSQMPLNFRADPANYIPAGAQDTESAPFCGVCIDGYAAVGPYSEPNNTPPPPPTYPTPRYPAWVGSTHPYNKALSSQCFIEDCLISSTHIGVMQQPLRNGNGDFTKLTRTSFSRQKIAYAWGNSQARNVDVSNVTVDYCHTAFDNCSYGENIGNLQGTWDNISVVGCYQIFNCKFVTGVPTCVNNLYAENSMRLGIANGPVTFESAHLSVHDTIIDYYFPIAISGIVWSGGTATVTTSSSLANAGWTYGTMPISITGANPAGYNVSGTGTLTGDNTFTYPIASPGTYVSGAAATVPKITEWREEPFFTNLSGAAQFRNCQFFDHIIYQFVGKPELINVNFSGPQGIVWGGMLTEGHRKAVNAFGFLLINQAPHIAAAKSPISGNLFQVCGRDANYQETGISWNGYNGRRGYDLWGFGQVDDGYSFEYDVLPMARQADISVTWGSLSGITRTATVSGLARVEVGDVLKPLDAATDTPSAWYVVESIAGSVLTVRQITDFTMISGVYASLAPDTFNTYYYPIGVLDLIPANRFNTPGVNGLFMKATAGSAVISLVDGADVAVTAMPTGLSLTSKPLWTGQPATYWANTLPFPANTTIVSIDTSAKTITMSANALVTGTWAYGPGIKRLK